MKKRLFLVVEAARFAEENNISSCSERLKSLKEYFISCINIVLKGCDLTLEKIDTRNKIYFKAF